MNTSKTGHSMIHPLRLAYDFVTGFSIDQRSALVSLRSHFNDMNEEEIRQWFEHMAELIANEELTGEALFALLGALDNIDSWH
jgi:hypothetical protein